MEKLSELMLEGYAMVGKQCVGAFCAGHPKFPLAVCGVGASQFAENGDASESSPNIDGQLFRFAIAVGVSVPTLNDKGMSIPDIAGIAAAEGL